LIQVAAGARDEVGMLGGNVVRFAKVGRQVV
jgi:hypothetical protein